MAEQTKQISASKMAPSFALVAWSVECGVQDSVMQSNETLSLNVNPYLDKFYTSSSQMEGLTDKRGCLWTKCFILCRVVRCSFERVNSLCSLKAKMILPTLFQEE